MKKYLILLALISLPAHAAVIHDTNETKSGWSFNYANTANTKEKIKFNIFVPKCQSTHDGCATDQREARTIANKQAAEIDKKLVEKHKKAVLKNPEKPVEE